MSNYAKMELHNKSLLKKDSVIEIFMWLYWVPYVSEKQFLLKRSPQPKEACNIIQEKKRK